MSKSKVCWIFAVFIFIAVVDVSLGGNRMSCSKPEISSGHLLSENDVAKEIVMHTPHIETQFSSLHPESALYEEVVDTDEARRQHLELVKVLRSKDITVHLLTDVMLRGTIHSNGSRLAGKALQELQHFAASFLKYDTTTAEQQYQAIMRSVHQYSAEIRDKITKRLKKIDLQLDANFQEEYRQRILKELSPRSLVNIILTRPTVHLLLDYWYLETDFDVVLRHQITLKPLGNLFYMRDQQITTAKGIVLLNSEYRYGEQEITQFVFNKLGLNVLGALEEGHAEGGDFVPFGDIVFIGNSMRTNYDAINYMMRKDWLGANQVFVVYIGRSMQRMHLDTVFNVVDEDKLLVLDDLLDNPSSFSTVDVYRRSPGVSLSNKTGSYVKVVSQKKFLDVLTELKIDVIRITDAEQRKYAPNFLNIGRRRLVTPYNEPSFTKRLSSLGLEVIPVDVSHLINGFGGIHCMTQVIHRAFECEKGS